MRTTSRVLLAALTVLAFAGCGGSGGSGGSKSAGDTQLTEKDGPGAPPACTDAACEPTPAPQCTADSQCPALPAMCSVCPDGSAACPSSVCENGQCNVVMPSCPKPTGCGGIAAQPCPDGYVCVTDPSNMCAPDSSGTNCPSVCVPENGPRKCGGLAGDVCPPAYKCVDDPSDDCDPAKGGADCIGICQPVDTGTCASDADCPNLMVECSVCPDGTTACPQSACVNGQCNVTVQSCPAPIACGGIGGVECKPGYECVDDPNDKCDPSAGGADCPAVCVPVAPPPPQRCGGMAGDVCPEGFECVGDPSTGCDPTNGSANCTGVCQPAQPAVCKRDADCPQLKVMCPICADGTAACAQSTCVNEQCNVTVPMCPTPSGCGGIAGIPCKDGYECVDAPNDMCDPNAGGADCPAICVPIGPPPPQRCGGIMGAACPKGFECVGDASTGCDPTKDSADCTGICQPVSSAVCQSDSDCLQVVLLRPPPPCPICADGTAACPQSLCVNGQCNVTVPMCPPPGGCGGIAGIPCKDGYECVDAPNDMCDPNAGGADCPGVCVPQSPPPLRCGGFAGTACPANFECVDDPADNCDPANGGADCGGLCQPVVAPQCTTDADCPVIGAPCKLCADGTAACPRSFCSNGQCAAFFEGCGPMPQ